MNGLVSVIFVEFCLDDLEFFFVYWLPEFHNMWQKLFYMLGS